MTMIDEYEYIPLNNKKLIFGDNVWQPQPLIK